MLWIRPAPYEDKSPEIIDSKLDFPHPHGHHYCTATQWQIQGGYSAPI